MKLPGCEDEKRSTAAGGERGKESEIVRAHVYASDRMRRWEGRENDREGTTDRKERLRGSREGGKKEE